jgi:predicted RecA/RadA family phage recombinase
MNSYKQPGEIMDFVNTTGGAIAVDTLLRINDRVGVACVDIAIGETGSVRVCGVVEVAKLSTDVVAQGDSLYFDEGDEHVTLSDGGGGSGGNILAGYAFSSAGNGATTVLLKLNG